MGTASFSASTSFLMTSARISRNVCSEAMSKSKSNGRDGESDTEVQMTSDGSGVNLCRRIENAARRMWNGVGSGSVGWADE